MNKLKLLLGAASLATAMAGNACTYVTNTASQNPAVVNNPSGEIDSRPNYLHSLPSQQEIDAMTPLQKRVESLMQLTLGRPEQDNPFTIYMNGCARADLDIHGSTVHLYLPFYTPVSDGKWKYRPDNTIVDSQPILDDLESVFEDGVNLAYGEYADFSERTNSVVNRVFPNASRDSDNPISGTKLVYNDVFGLIDIQKTDFLPDGANVIFAPSEAGVYAITQLERNAILYTPDARRSDAIWGRAGVFAHELIHNNTTLQNIPSLLETDLEIQTFTLNIADKSNLFLFLKHGYGKPMRETALRYFGVDASAIYDRLVKLEFDNYVEIDEQYLNEMAPTIVNIVSILHDAMMEKAQPEYQAMMPWWLMAEAYFRNDHLPLEVAIAARYDPSTLTPQQMLKITNNRRQIERLIDDVKSSYTMPEMGSFFGMTFTDGDTFEDAVYNKAKSAGYDEQQCDFIYDMALERIFIKGNGINYGAMSVDNAIQGMKDYMDVFDEFMTSEPEELSRGLRGMREQPDVVRRHAAYQWMQGRLEAADRYIGFAERRGQSPSAAFDPLILDPRADLAAHYNVTPRVEDASLVSQISLSTGGLGYIIESYDLDPVNGFSADDTSDMVLVFHEGDSLPCIAATANGEQFGNQMLVDYGNGVHADGLFDEQFAISGMEDIINMINGQKPSEE